MYNDYFYDAKQTSDNGFIMSGNTTDGWLVKVDSNGCEGANCFTGINNRNEKNLKLNVFPNPSSSEINISIENDNISNYEIAVINILGEEQKTERNQSIISIAEFSSGIYFVVAKKKDGKYQFSKKLIKE